VHCFSQVYRGELEDGRLLAIKCLQNSENQEFLLTRGLEINSCLSHANIVSLIGYCVENTQLILVYDFLRQQTLRDLLHGTRTRHRNPLLVGESSKS
jgi:serine/threonine protein kinase